MKESTMLPVYVQATPTIFESHVCNVSPKEYNWAVDIRANLQTGALPEDPKRAHKIRVQASHFLRVSHIRNSVEAAPIQMAAYHQKIAILSHLFKQGQIGDIKGGIVGSSLKIVAWLPLHCDTWHHSFHPDISHPDPANVLPYPDVSQPPFYPADIPLSPDVSQPQFYPATFSEYFTSSTYRRMGEEDHSTSPDRHVWIL